MVCVMNLKNNTELISDCLKPWLVKLVFKCVGEENERICLDRSEDLVGHVKRRIITDDEIKNALVDF